MKKLIFVVVLLASLFIFPGDGVVLTSANDDAPPDLPVGRLTYPPDIESKLEVYKNLSPEAAARMAEAQETQSDLKVSENNPITEISQPDATDNADLYKACVMESYAGNFDIFRVDLCPNGTISQLTYTGAVDILPRLNRGATRIVFVSDRDGNYEIYSMDYGGGDVKRLTNSLGVDTRPDWSPDGNKIIFASDRSGNQEIYTMNADGSGLQRITYNPAPDFDPTWSPDGTQIAWVRAVSSTDGVIIKSNVDGSGAIANSEPLRYIQDLIWSPLGTHLGFTYDPNFDGWWNAGTIKSDGTSQQLVNVGAADIDIIMGGWSPKQGQLLIGYIEWLNYNSAWYIIDAYVEFIFEYNHVRTGMFDFYPHTQSVDVTPPESWMTPLPEFSQADGFEIEVNAVESGRTMINTWEIYWRDGLNGVWAGFPLAYNRKATFNLGQGGQTIYFYSHTMDGAENHEPLPPAGYDEVTKIYSWLVKGTISDNRSLPVPNGTIDLNPASWFTPQTSGSGSYLAYLISTGVHNILNSHAGYGSLPASILDIQRDSELKSYLPPEVNWLNNGGFESQPDSFEDWRVSGLITPTIENGHSGIASARLGVSCVAPCLTPTMDLTDDITAIESDPFILADSSGNVHILYNNQKYIMRDAAGNWSSPVVIGDLPAPDNSSIDAILAIDPQQTLHAIVAADYRYKYYFNKPAGGTWGSMHELPYSNTKPLAMAANSLGTVVIVYTDSFTTYYVYRSPSGIWSEQITLFGYAVNGIELVSLEDNKFKMLRSDNSSTCLLGFDSMGLYIPGSEGCQPGNRTVHLLVGPNGTLHALSAFYNPFEWKTDWYYSSISSVGAWSAPIILPGNLADADLAVDPEGTVHVLGIDALDNGFPIYYYRKTAQENSFNKSYAFKGSYFRNISVTSNHTGAIFVTWGDWHTLKYREPLTWPGPGASSLSTSLTIPTGAHRPTLAFMYALGGNGGAQPSFNLSLTTQGTTPATTTLFSTSQNTDWKHAWVDLQDWAGQTVTVTYGLGAPQGSPAAYARLDSISVGEWWTPRVISMAPTEILAGEPFSLTLMGENFIEPPQVFFDLLQADSVTWVDEHNLIVNIPEGLPVGQYIVRVINPGGQEGWAAEKMIVKMRYFLPIVLR